MKQLMVYDKPKQHLCTPVAIICDSDVSSEFIDRFVLKNMNRRQCTCGNRSYVSLKCK